MRSDRNAVESPRRTLGPAAALAIGTGTMVGAGIFVFPGIAGAEAGPAAALSFALSGTVALMVAACTAELATAMPSRSIISTGRTIANSIRAAPLSSRARRRHRHWRW